MPIRGRTHDHLRGDIAASARPVFDDELLAKPFRQPLTHQAREDVIRTAWSKADDNAHRPRRIGLGPCNAGYNRQCGERDRGDEDSAAQHGDASGDRRAGMRTPDATVTAVTLRLRPIDGSSNLQYHYSRSAIWISPMPW